MKIVGERSQADAGSSAVSSEAVLVPPADAAAFRAVYGDREGYTPAQRVRALALFGRGRKSDGFDCDCLAGTSQPRILCKSDGSVQRHPKSPEHRQGCSFRRTLAERRAHKRTYKRPAANKEFTFLWDPTAPAEIRARGNEEEAALGSTSSGNSGHRPALATLLFALLQDSGWHKTSSTEPKTWPDLNELSYNARKFKIAGDIVLRDVLATDLRRLSHVQRHIQEIRWPENVAPQGFYIGVVDEIKVGQLMFHRFNYNLAIQCPISTFGESGAWARKPYLFIGVFSTQAMPVDTPGGQGGTPIFEKVYAHPVVGPGKWMPLDSNMERRSLGSIEDALGYLLTKQRIVSWEIEKPLFDIPPKDDDDDGNVCRPDFLIRFQIDEKRSGEVLVETMGSDGLEYLEGKAITHARMARIAPLVLHETHSDNVGAEDDAFNKRLLSAIHQIVDLKPKT